jgi:WD40 repeat protein
MRAHIGSVLAVAISDDGEYVASGGQDKIIRVIEARSGEEI